MNTDTPETDQAESNKAKIAFASLFPCDGYDHARKMERERDEIRAQLREEQQLHVQTLNERDEARETSWFSNGIEYRKRNDYIEARNNLNPHWVVVDSPTNQKP